MIRELTQTNVVGTGVAAAGPLVVLTNVEQESTLLEKLVYFEGGNSADW